MTMMITHDHQENHGSIGVVRSVLNALTGIFTAMVAARECQMRYRIDSGPEDQDREMLIALGHERPVRPRVSHARFAV